jgi:hypothetical protein
LNEALGVKKKKKRERERGMIIVHKLLRAFSFLFAMKFIICVSKNNKMIKAI